jgi:integrase
VTASSATFIRFAFSPSLLGHPFSEGGVNNGCRANRRRRDHPQRGRGIAHIKSCLHTALKTGVRWGMLEKNPMELVEMPKLEKREQAALDEPAMDRLLAAAEGTRLHPFLVLAFATGARRGELLALQWADLDADTGRLRIAKSLEQTMTYGIRVKPSTKSKKPRSFTVPGWALDVILQHRDRQQSESVLFGEDYKKHDLIFCQPDGSYYSPDKIGTRVTRLAAKAGFQNIHLHSLRHSHASQLLSQGVPLPVVSKRLGHADSSITAKVYAHCLPDDDATAAEIWNSARRKVVADKTAEANGMLANVSFDEPEKRLKLVKSIG